MLILSSVITFVNDKWAKVLNMQVKKQGETFPSYIWQ